MAKKFTTREEIDNYLSGDYIQCLECLEMFKSLPFHIWAAHGIRIKNYKIKYGIPLSCGLVGKSTSKKISNHSKQLVERGLVFTDSVKEAFAETRRKRNQGLGNYGIKAYRKPIKKGCHNTEKELASKAARKQRTKENHLDNYFAALNDAWDNKKTIKLALKERGYTSQDLRQFMHIHKDEVELIALNKKIIDRGRAGVAKSGYKGVVKNHQKYDAQFRHNKKLYRIGGFETPEEAHKAYLKLKEKVLTTNKKPA